MKVSVVHVFNRSLFVCKEIIMFLYQSTMHFDGYIWRENLVKFKHCNYEHLKQSEFPLNRALSSVNDLNSVNFIYWNTNGFNLKQLPLIV